MGFCCPGTVVRRIGQSYGDVPFVRTALDAHVLRQQWENSQHHSGPWPPAARSLRGSTPNCFQTVNTRPVLLRVGREPNMPRARYTEDMLQQDRQLHRILIHHVRAQLQSPQFLHDSVRGSKRSRRTMQLDSLLSLPLDTARPPAASMVIATPKVLTLHPQEEDQGETWAPSARRAVTAKQIREVGVDILGVQESRSRKDHSVFCEGYAMWMSAATPGGSGGTELWINTSSCDHTQAVVTRPDWWSPAGLVVTFSTIVFYMHPRRTLLNGPRNGGTRRDRSFARCSGRLATESS